MSDILGFVLEAARGRRRRWRTRRWRKVVRWVVRRGWASEKGGGGWLALLICKTANLRTLCLPALSSSFSTFSTTAFSSYGRPLLALSRFYPLSPLPLLSLSRSLDSFRLSLSSSLTHASRPLQTRIPIHIVTLSLSPFSSVSLACVPSSLWYVP